VLAEVQCRIAFWTCRVVAEYFNIVSFEALRLGAKKVILVDLLFYSMEFDVSY
jgi:hypothetical protein